MPKATAESKRARCAHLVACVGAAASVCGAGRRRRAGGRVLAASRRGGRLYPMASRAAQPKACPPTPRAPLSRAVQLPPPTHPLAPPYTHLWQLSQAIEWVDVGGGEALVPHHAVVVQLDLEHRMQSRLQAGGAQGGRRIGGFAVRGARQDEQPGDGQENKGWEHQGGSTQHAVVCYQPQDNIPNTSCKTNKSAASLLGAPCSCRSRPGAAQARGR